MGIGLEFGMFGLLLMVLLWGGLIALGAWLVSRLFPRNAQASASAAGNDLNACGILDRRYSRGEISREQYELMKQDVGGCQTIPLQHRKWDLA